MLRLIVGAAITLTLALGPRAAMAAELKIGVVDPEVIAMDSAEGKRIQDAIKKKYEDLGKPLGAKGQELDRQVQEFQKTAGTMKEDARKRKEEELSKKVQDLQRQKADSEKQLNQFQESQLAPLGKKMEQAIEQVTKDEKLDLVLNKRMVVYLGNKALDISDKVRAKFGK
jgi:outer membrane protein